MSRRLSAVVALVVLLAVAGLGLAEVLIPCEACR